MTNHRPNSVDFVVNKSSRTVHQALLPTEVSGSSESAEAKQCGAETAMDLHRLLPRSKAFLQRNIICAGI